jgi:hypothetical protein
VNFEGFRGLAARAIVGTEEPASLKREFVQLLQQGVPRELQLPYAYLALIAHLLQLDPLLVHPDQFPNGAAYVDTIGMTTGHRTPEPTYLSELGSLWMILGVCQRNEPLVYAGLKVAYWQSYLLDSAGFPHVSLWSLARDYSPSLLSAFHYLLLTLAYRITSGQGFLQAAQTQKIKGWDPTSIAGKLLSLVPDPLVNPIRLPFRPLTEEITLGMLKFTMAEWSCMCGVSGWNSGVFSYHKKGIAIVNSGPQWAPLDALDRFGIEREGGPFHDLIWEKTAHHFRLKGWTKLFSCQTWMMMDCHYQAGRVKLSCELQEGHSTEGLYFVFYAACDRLSIVGKKILSAGTMQRYQGKALPVEISGENEVFFIEPEAAEQMEVIPLAGGPYFFGSQFLIAYQFKEKNLLQFVLR